MSGNNSALSSGWGWSGLVLALELAWESSWIWLLELAWESSWIWQRPSPAALVLALVLVLGRARESAWESAWIWILNLKASPGLAVESRHLFSGGILRHNCPEAVATRRRGLEPRLRGGGGGLLGNWSSALSLLFVRDFVD